MSFDCELKPDLVRLVCTYGYNRELKNENKENGIRKTKVTTVTILIAKQMQMKLH